MIANVNEKGRQTKLLVAIAVIAMVVCAVAIALPGTEADESTSNQYLAAADDYSGYTDYTYVGDRTIDGTSVMMTYEGAFDADMAESVMNDFARYMGALYRANTDSVVGIIYDGVNYNWNISPTNLAGSNWRDSDGNTLVSAVTADVVAQINNLYQGGSINLTMVLSDESTVAFTYGMNGAVASLGTTYYGSVETAVTAATGTDTVTLIDDIVVDKTITITKAVTIDGDGHSISANANVNWEGNGTKNVISINGVSGTVTLRDLVVDSNDKAYGINIYQTNSVALESVTSIDSYGAGVVVNGSTATVTQSEMSGNLWGDINVDKASTFTIDANSVLGSNFQIYSEDAGADTGGSTITAEDYVAYDWTKSGVTNGEVYFKDGIVQDLTVNSGETITIPSGQTLTISGSLTLLGTIDGQYTAGEKAQSVSDAESITNALQDDTVDSLIYTGTGAITGADQITLDKPLTVTDIASANGLTLTQGGSIEVSPADGTTITVNSDVTVNGGNGSVTITSGFTADSISFYYGSAGTEIVNGSGPITFNGESRIRGTIGGNLTINTNGTANITVDPTLQFVNTASLTISGGVTLNAGSNITVAEGVTGCSIINNGTLVYSSIPSSITVTNNGTLRIDGAQGTEQIISTTQTINGTFYLTGDTTINEGVTLTIGRNATLDLMGYDLTVNGNLVIERNGVITSSFSSDSDVSTISLTRTGSIQNNSGIIGDEMPIRIANGMVDETQYVELQGVSGVSFEFVRNVTSSGGVNTVTYNMAVSGDISRVSGVEVHEITLMNVDISADMTIGSNVTLYVNGETVVDNDVTFTHNGALMQIAETANFELRNGASAVINSLIGGEITVAVGEVDSGNTLFGTDTASVDFTLGTVTDGSYSASGITVSVGRVTIPNDDGTSDVYQRMYVSGSLDVELNYRVSGSGNSPAATIAFDGPVFVSESLYIPADVNVTGNDYYFDVSGAGIVTVEEDGTALKYSGARYVLETTENNVTVETTYYTTFDAAMSQIGNAQDGVIFISGSYEITGTYEVGDEQEIDVDNSTSYIDDMSITVGENGQITVSEDGTIDNAAFTKIDGRVIALAGTGYRPAEGQGIYAVVTVDSETNDTTYSGFKIALDNATAGETITVVDNATYDGNMVVPANVTVNVDDGWTLTVLGNVTVEAEGVLNLNTGATLAVGERADRDYTITVSGTLDASEGGYIDNNTASTDNVDLYSTGTTTMANDDSITDVTPNAASYMDGVEVVYTSVANAVAFAEENALASVTATGTFTETGDVESDGVNIIIASGADVTFGNVTINNAYIGGDGTYTATVSGLTGTGDATSTVSVNKTTATVDSDVTMDATGAYEYALTINGIVGNTTVSAGTVEFVGAAITAQRNNALTIESGATLLIPEDNNNDVRIIGGEYISNEGTIRIDGTASIVGNTVLAGDIIVAEDGTFDVDSSYSLTVTGNVTVETDGSMTVYGTLVVGEVPDLLSSSTTGTVAGTVTLSGNAPVYVFSGASVTDATFQDATGSTDVDSTAYTINGIDYTTIYTMGDVRITDVNAFVTDLRDLVTYEAATPDITWYAGETTIRNQSVGDYSEVSTEIRYSSAPINISIGSQISLVIDGIVYGSSAGEYLTIGTHTVSAIVNPGFTGDVTITFNGQTVTNGEFEITSDMIDPLNPIILSATGNITQDQSVINVGESDMGLTDYLLIVLVVLIVIMAIMVALRLMRS